MCRGEFYDKALILDSLRSICESQKPKSATAMNNSALHGTSYLAKPAAPEYVLKTVRPDFVCQAPLALLDLTLLCSNCYACIDTAEVRQRNMAREEGN